MPKGRKICKKCNAENSLRAIACISCGASFEKAQPREVQIFDEPAKGRKPCPCCHKYISGYRTAVCPNCGFDFQANPHTANEEIRNGQVVGPFTTAKDLIDSLNNDVLGEPEEDPAKTLRQQLREMIIAVPAGACPVKLKGTDEDSVREWAEAVIATGEQSDRTYTFSALRYWVNSDFYPRFTAVAEETNPDYTKVVETLAELMEV